MYMWIKNISQILQDGIHFLDYCTFPTPRRGAEGTIRCKKQWPCSKTSAHLIVLKKLVHVDLIAITSLIFGLSTHVYTLFAAGIADMHV